MIHRPCNEASQKYGAVEKNKKKKQVDFHNHHTFAGNLKTLGFKTSAIVVVPYSFDIMIAFPTPLPSILP